MVTQSGETLKIPPTMPLDAPRLAACEVRGVQGRGGRPGLTQESQTVQTGAKQTCFYFIFTSAGKNGPNTDWLDIAMA